MPRILVTGSRDWTDRILIVNELVKAWTDLGQARETILVHGGAKGADAIADEFWRGAWMLVEVHPADWGSLGRAAGPIRNKEMVEAGADLCLAFIKDGSRGATGCADMAEAAGIPTRRFYADVPYDD